MQESYDDMPLKRPLNGWMYQQGISEWRAAVHKVERAGYDAEKAGGCATACTLKNIEALALMVWRRFPSRSYMMVRRLKRLRCANITT